MTTLLALDTATEACSVALWYQGKVYHRYEVIPRLHAQQLLPMLQQVLADAHTNLSAVDAFVVGCGPGAFTGVRIAAGVVQGLAFALDKPVIAISDLALIAQRAWREYRITQAAVAIDARMDEIYWGCYVLKDEVMHSLAPEQVIAPEQATLPNTILDGWSGVGTGWRYEDQISVKCPVVNVNLLPDARDLLTLGFIAWQDQRAIAAELLEPVYLRNNVAIPKKM